MAIRQGANEMDMVMNVGLLKGGERDAVQRILPSLAAACHAGGAILKVILETALLNDERSELLVSLRRKPARISSRHRPASAPSGATESDVALMRMRSARKWA